MQVVHTTTIVAQCPKGCADVYRAEFHTDRLVMVEEIATAIGIANAATTTQEELTQRLAHGTGCRVVTTGRHGLFDTRVEANPSE